MAQTPEQEAKTAEESAAFEERQFRARIAEHLAKARAIGAASGIVPISGSPMLLEMASTQQAEIEALNIRRTGRITSSGLEFESRLRKYEAGATRTRGAFESSLKRSESSFLRSQIPLIAAGGVLKAAGSVLDYWSANGGGAGSNWRWRGGQGSRPVSWGG